MTTLRELDFDDALAYVEGGASFIDLRPIDDYLDVHVPGSLALLYESGPGMAARARDCLPLELPLVLLDLGHGDIEHAAASLRGKGFSVLGRVTNGINQWARRRGAPASTEVVTGNRGGRTGTEPLTILDVADPGAGKVQDATFIPIEKLWSRLSEFAGRSSVVVASGYGVRAALAVGMLERARVKHVIFWKP